MDGQIRPISFGGGLPMRLSLPHFAAPPPSQQQQQRLVYYEELRDNKHIKAAAQSAGYRPAELWNEQQQPQTSWFWPILISIVVVALVAIVSIVFFSVRASSSSHPAAAALPISSSVRLRTTELYPQYDGGGAKEPPTPDALDPASLDSKRRGSCSPPESISKWVCGDNNSSIDAYLMSRADAWIRHALEGVGARGPFLETAVRRCGKRDEPSVLLERLKKEMMAADSPRTLSYSLGVAASFGIPLSVCFRGGVTRCGNVTGRSDFYDEDAFADGLRDGWKRVGASSIANGNWTMEFPFFEPTIERSRAAFASKIAAHSFSLSHRDRMRAELSPFVQSFVLRQLSAAGGPLDADGPAVLYLSRAFEQLRESYAEAAKAAGRPTDRISSMRLFVPPFPALGALTVAADGSVGTATGTCRDALVVADASRTARAASGTFSEEELELADMDLLTPSPGFKLVRYAPPPLHGVIVAPLALSPSLYKPPSADSYHSMVDMYGRLGWRIAREMATGESLPEKVATCVAYRVLCKHGPARCQSIESEDLDWIRRMLWDVAGANCGDSRIDSGVVPYSLYRVAFACNGLYLHRNASSEVMNCWAK